MRITQRALMALFVCFQLHIHTIVASSNCPLISLEFPKPRNLSGHPVMQQAITDLDEIFDYINTNVTASGSSNYSYSVQVYSANPGPSVLYEKYHTATNLDAVNASGVRNVDENTVYRLGSLTKVFTLLAFLVTDGDTHWNDPITKYVPEVANLSSSTSSGKNDPVMDTDWDDVTLGNLATQMSGIARDYGVLGEVTQDMDMQTSESVGFPPLPPSQVPTCGEWPLCNRTEFFQGLAQLPPSFGPAVSPAYSDIAYQLLAYALETISGKPFYQVLNETVLIPLNLTNTYYFYANETVGIVPGTINDTYWYVSLGEESPAGNMYSSAKDLTTLGLSILKSTLIKPALTRRWLKPADFTSDFVASIGAPWGIRRINISTTSDYRNILTYVKAGRFRWYSSLVALLPDWNLGFTILGAGNYTDNIGFEFADLIGEVIIPAYDYIARDEADQIYSGVYSSQSDLNSSLTISTNSSKPGLGISPWISNGTDMVDYGLRLNTGSDTPGMQPEVRLYYSKRETVAADGSKRQAFKAVFEDTGYPPVEGKMFSTDCASWLELTGVTYGALPLDEFVFNLDPNGNVVSLENLALRDILYKVS